MPPWQSPLTQKAYDVLVVGSGFAGATCAERLAQAGFSVLIIDRRGHVGGNAFDHFDAHGVLVHKYGPHIFHTNSERIFSYLSRFTEWRLYEHRVRSIVDGVSYPMPINQDTINLLYGLKLDETGVANFLARSRQPRAPLLTSEDVVLDSVGFDLCEKFFRGYTFKQWGMDLSELSAAVAARIPTRTNRDDRYFTDRYQTMPLEGYTRLFERMLDHPLIELGTGLNYRDICGSIAFRRLIFTGPIDEYFDYCFGHLPYRSIRFEHQHLANLKQYQQTGTVNYPNDFEFTRVTEFRHLTGQQHHGTSILREYPCDQGDPYYPVPRAENEVLFKRYQALAEQQQNVVFVGRLAQYRYYNMDQVVASALDVAQKVTQGLTLTD